MKVIDFEDAACRRIQGYLDSYLDGELLVEPSSHLINRSVSDIDVFERYDISILGLVRAENEGTLMAPGPYNRIRSDDVLILQGEPEAIMRMRKDLDLRQREAARVGDVALVSGDVHLVEAIVPGNSDLSRRIALATAEEAKNLVEEARNLEQQIDTDFSFLLSP